MVITTAMFMFDETVKLIRFKIKIIVLAKKINSIRYWLPNAPARYEAAVIITTGGPMGMIERYKSFVANPAFLPNASFTNVALPPALGYIMPSFPNTNATGKIIIAITNHKISEAHPLYVALRAGTINTPLPRSVITIVAIPWVNESFT